jgi:hypothetical protein
MPPSSFKGNEVLGELGGSVLDRSVWIREVGGPAVLSQLLTSIQMPELPRIDPSAPGANSRNEGTGHTTVVCAE